MKRSKSGRGADREGASRSPPRRRRSNAPHRASGLSCSKLKPHSTAALYFLERRFYYRRMSEPPDPFDLPSSDPPPIVQIGNALDDLSETVNELAKHEMPARLRREVNSLIAEAKNNIHAMRPDNPSMKKIMLIAGAFLVPKFQTGKATEAHQAQSKARSEARIAAIERLGLAIVALRRITGEDLAKKLAKDRDNLDEKGRPLFGMTRRQVSDAKKTLLEHTEKLWRNRRYRQTTELFASVCAAFRRFPRGILTQQRDKDVAMAVNTSTDDDGGAPEVLFTEQQTADLSFGGSLYLLRRARTDGSGPPWVRMAGNTSIRRKGLRSISAPCSNFVQRRNFTARTLQPPNSRSAPAAPLTMPAPSAGPSRHRSRTRAQARKQRPRRPKQTENFEESGEGLGRPPVRPVGRPGG